ncbi:hypothetical protein [Salinithrix halophila]|uniref:NodB homology domain-containing protein n=1 Tax=Salinithrix halophila TaxID=1485204 RepID=A0ABV8JEU0_9BACL
MRMARVGVLFDVRVAKRRWARGENTFQRYIGEILEYAGIPFCWLDGPEGLFSEPFDLCVAALTQEGKESEDILLSFAERGGEVIAFGGLDGLGTRLGVREGKVEGPGYTRFPEEDHPLLRYLEAVPWIPLRARLSEVRGTLHSGVPDGPKVGSAVVRLPFGRGGITRWAVDLPSTILQLQQGARPVRKDGKPAPDGSGALDDGILKADDGFALDWEWDRAVTPTGQKYFAIPYGDWWREEIIRSLTTAALDRGLTLPRIDPWPEKANRVAMISLDSDGNQDEHAETTLDLLAECGVSATWCMMEPGYSPKLYSRIREAGHEVAFHFNAYERDGGEWEEREFHRQLAWLRKVAGSSSVVSNKNHYTRFQGWTELFAWCERAGIRSDQTRGPSKRGNVGFLFGTCRPYFPLSWAEEGNRRLDVLEIGFLTQDLDLGSWADSSIIEPFLDRVGQVQGVAHFLFHPIHLHRDEKVRSALRRVVREAKRCGFGFWTGEAIDDWERRRRRLTIQGVSEGGEPIVKGAVAGAVLSVPLPEGAAGLNKRGQVRKWMLTAGVTPAEQGGAR